MQHDRGGGGGGGPNGSEMGIACIALPKVAKFAASRSS